MSQEAGELAGIRAGIDEIDERIVELLASREAFVRRAAPLKKDTAAVRAPDRVAQVVARVRGLAAQSGADPDVVERIYRGLIDAYIAMETTEHHNTRH